MKSAILVKLSLCILFVINKVLGQLNELTILIDSKLLIENGNLQPQFSNIEVNYGNCLQERNFQFNFENAEGKQRNISLRVTNPSKLANPIQYNLKSNDNIYSPSIVGSINTSDSNTTQENFILFSCPDQVNDQNYWTHFQLATYANEQDQPITATFIVSCFPDYRKSRFNGGLILLTAISMFLLVLMVRKRQIIAFPWNRQKIDISIKFSFIYVLAFVLIALLLLVGGQVVVIIIDILMTVVGALCTSFYIVEILHIIPYLAESNKRIWIFRIHDLIGIFIGLLFFILFWSIQRPWFISDAMSMFILGTFILFFKFQKNLKRVAIIFIILILADWTGAIAIHFMKKDVSYDTQIVNLLVNPLSVSVPLMMSDLYQKCAWLPLTSLLTVGLYMQLIQRIDFGITGTESKKQLILTTIGFIIGMLIYICITLGTHAVPVSISYIFLWIPLLIYSSRRSQFATLWEGRWTDLMEDNLAEEMSIASANEDLIDSDFLANSDAENANNL